MILALILMRWASVLGWLVVMAVTARPTLRAFTKRKRHHDLLWALIFGGALNRVWFSARGIAFNSDLPTWLPEQLLLLSSYLFGLLLAWLSVQAFYWYREPRL